MSSGRTVLINGIHLWYNLVGRGPTLIIQCPGWGTGSGYLQQTLVPLQDHFQILYYDTRGSGRSRLPESSREISVGHMVRDLEALRHHLNISQFALLGHSHGAFISLNYALKHPDHIFSLVLISPQVGQSEVLQDVRRNLPILQNQPKYQAAARELQKAKSPRTDEEFGKWLKRVSPLYFYDPEVGRSYWDQMNLQAIARTTCRAVSASNARYAVNGHLRNILISTLVIVGEHDFVTSPRQARVIQKEVPGCETLILKRSGHFPWLEEPDKVYPAIIHFLQRDIEEHRK